MKNLVSLFFLILFVNASCTKDEEIPTGNRTFSCRINGELFIPKSDAPLLTVGPVGDGLSYLNYPLFFSATAYNPIYTVYFNIVNWNLNTFNLVNSNGLIAPSDSHAINHVVVIKNGKKYLSKEGSGTVTFTEVTTTEVKGTFAFTLYNENDNSDVIRITEGKFDN